ncbi:MAG: hypothetical protein HEP71_11595 [Roseivirga sp.]|nr:hypothetical protein [Roseivirga sp.]
MNLKAFFLFYKQAWLVYLLIHGAAVYLALSGDLGKVIHLLLFLKSGQYLSIYFFYKRFNPGSLIWFMNLGIKLRHLFTFTYVLDMLILILTLILIKL